MTQITFSYFGLDLRYYLRSIWAGFTRSTQAAMAHPQERYVWQDREIRFDVPLSLDKLAIVVIKL